MTVKERIKSAVLASRYGRRAYGLGQELWFEADYRARRERYESVLANQKESVSDEAALARARDRIAARGYTPQPRRMGQVHSYAYVPGNWPHQNHIARALEALGPCRRFDYTRHGFELKTLRTREAGSEGFRRALLDLLFNDLRETHRAQPVDWFFSYALGWDITADLVRRIQSELGIPTVNISLDDKNWWDEIERGDRASGLRNIAPAYDLGWTSARVVLPWYRAEGGQAMFLPEGVDVDWFRPLEVEQDIDIGFVGNNFGYRADVIERLRRAGLRVTVRGNQWPEGSISDEEMLVFFNRCRINLGMGEMHFSRRLTNLKGRDFEIPATGRGVYLTSYNSDLASCFNVGQEIACYRDIDELIELARHYLRNPQLGGQMGSRARQRCVEEHQWSHRHAAVLRALGVLESG